MFEDSTFESTGRIRTRSRGWMFAALALNSTILVAIILVPLIYPEALPRQAMLFLLAAPMPPAAATPTNQRTVQHPSTGPAVDAPNPFAAPRRIPTTIATGPDTAPPPSGPFSAFSTSGDPFGIGPGLSSQPPRRVVAPEPNAPIRVPSTLAAGLLLRKVVPGYPALAKAMHIQGTIVLAATIAKDGTIANLRVLSGTAILQQSALEAVSQWHYRPYLLNGQPVDVETTVNVVYTLAN